VNQVAEDLGLVKCFNTLVGSPLKKTISGGERKRVSIGVEMISDPSLLMLDEPTSGLDSFKSLELLKLLYEFARFRGKTIIATIHQPSSQCFGYFDKLFLLAEGRIIYQGRALKC